MVKTWKLVPAVPVGAAGEKFLKFGAFFFIFKAIFRFLFTVGMEGCRRAWGAVGEKFFAIGLLILKFVKFSTKF